MKINWCISEEITRGKIEPSILMGIAPVWGSYRTWKEYKTDNCISNDADETAELIRRGFNTVCNHWVPESIFVQLGRPSGLKLFGGEFGNTKARYKDDIVALWLASHKTDIVLMVGYDLREFDDKLDYHRSLKKIIRDHPDTQYVLVEYKRKLSKTFNDLPNFSTDSLQSVRDLLQPT